MSNTNQFNKSNDAEIREKYRKRLLELSKPEKEDLEFKVDGSIWRNGKILAEEPSYEQKAWVIRRMKAPSWTWRSWSD